MIQTDVKILLEMLGHFEHHYAVRDNRLYLCCPIAGLTHSNGVDKHPSANISLSDSGISFFRCFGCSPESGRPLEWLLHKVWLMWGEYPHEAGEFLSQHECWGDQEDEDSEISINDPWATWEEEAPQQTIPPAVYEKLPLLGVSNGPVAKSAKIWLQKRLIDLELLIEFGVRYHPARKAIIFPFTIHNGDVVGLSARLIARKEMFSLTHKMMGHDTRFPSAKKRGGWFGLSRINWKEPVWLVEGCIDALRLASLGKTNVIASGGTSVTKEQLSLIYGLDLRLGFDSDEAGEKITKHVLKKMGWVVREIMDWKAVGCKDPGDLPNRVALNKVIAKAFKTY